MIGSFHRELWATLASRHTAVCTDAHRSIRRIQSILGAVRVFALLLRVLQYERISTARERSAHNSSNISAVHKAKMLPKMAVSSQLTTSTGSTCDIEPRTNRSSGSVNVHNPKYCEYTRSIRAVHRTRTYCYYSQYEQYRTLKYCQSVLEVSPSVSPAQIPYGASVQQGDDMIYRSYMIQ